MKNKKYILIGLTLVVLVLIVAIVLINRKAEFSVKGDNNSPVTLAVEEGIPIASANEETAPSSLPTVPTDRSVPILMYHHIRDYNLESDQAGITLSVGTADFARQLDLIQSRGYKTTNFLEIESGKMPEKPIILTFDDGYQNFYENAYPELKKREMTGIVYVIADKTASLYMTREEIKTVAENYIEVGSHTLSHPDLTVLTEEKEKIEIRQSKTKIEAITGKTIVSFCYPSGKYKPETIDMLKAAGYKYAVTTKRGIAELSSPFELSRYRINNGTGISNLVP